ncbi:MAG: TlpA disulfide reductase family protein, partial [Chloroflexi bacterium]|nr:TlpA disulfide reductase family protein [Chloroflexota bacterium]
PNGNTNGNEPNGNEPNGDEPNGNEPAEPDLINGPGVIIDCEEYTGQGLQPLDPAPDFSFEDAAGSTFSLSDFQGKMVMLNFWATRCGYCVMELPYLQQIYEEWPSDELLLLAVDVSESADKVNAYLADNGISLPVLLDIEAEVKAQYLVQSIPRTFFIDKEGLIQGIKFGAFSGVEEIESILEQLSALQGG